MENINFDELLNGNEISFKIPLQHNMNVFQTIGNIIDNMDFTLFDVEFEIDMDEDNDISILTSPPYLVHNFYNNTNYIEQDKKFKYCYEIDNKLTKAEKIKNNDSVLNDGVQCFICMDEYKINQYKRVLPKCKHFYHKKCIDKWLKKKSSCPICRDDLI